MEDRTDFIVVGSGIAGLRAAVALAGVGRVTVLTKDAAGQSVNPHLELTSTSN
ncbi:MAG: FAD-binding protein [Blastocatellia bacterium]|nr:FAD-binding protein [Blastocatellia bacterium]